MNLISPLRDTNDKMTSLNMFYYMLKHNKLQKKTHQVDGLKWMLEHEEKPILHSEPSHYGGILAYDMGLGKTIMTLGLLLCNYKEKTLIVVPAIILEQWDETIYKYINHKALIWHGEKKKDNLLDKPIIVTTYHQLLQKDTELLKQTYDRIIFDEAHHLKNKTTKLYKLVCNIKCPIKWLLTGTPIQNDIYNLYNLFYILNPNIQTHIQEKKKNIVNNPIFQLLINSIVLSLSKKETDIKMPNLNIQKIVVPWKTNYEISQVKTHVKDYSDKNNIVKVIRERQCCIDVSIIKSCEINKDFISSKQYAIIQKISKRIDNNRPKIVFCHFVLEISKFKMLLQKRFPNKIICSLTGKTTKKEKQEYLNVGNNNKHIDILIIQIQTWNEGLNLQYFKEMYFSSPHWNPCIELQAIGRIYRINQNDPINVYYFFMDDLNNNYTNKYNYYLLLMHTNASDNDKLNKVIDIFKYTILEYLVGSDKIDYKLLPKQIFRKQGNNTMDLNILDKQCKKIKIYKAIKNIQTQYKTYVKHNVDIILSQAVYNQSCDVERLSSVNSNVSSI